MDNRDLWLAARLVELAESADTDATDAVGAEQLTTSLAELLAPAEIGLLLSDDAGAMTVVAGSSGRARDLVSLEARQADGPCTECAALARPVLNEHIEQVAARFPAFAAAAHAAGFGAVSVLPMRRRQQVIGVISVLVPGQRALTDSDLHLAQILARAAAVAIAQQRELRKQTQTARQLQRALDSRVLIEQAKGATVARLGITPDAAFDLLRAHARRESRTLIDIAREIVSGELATHDLLAPRPIDAKGTARAAGQSR